ncbi:MAG TPA: peptidylprolyl isomerase [Sphingomicrobium sp.]|jgi:peptidylprolyl isomerase|nr:peptidylprolyl isomerase [Sphingomicrobium sp.]
MKFLALPFVAFALIAAKADEPAASTLPINPPPSVLADPANELTLQLSNGGTVVIELRPDAAPNHVKRVQTLVRQGFYDGTIFHRVIPGFMAQGGDPTGTGEGGSKLPDLKAEFNSLPHLRGTVSAARTADSTDTANSQFFIMFTPNASLNGDYTVFGRVTSGMEAVDSIAPGQPPANPTKIVHASLGDGSAPPARPTAPAAVEATVPLTLPAAEAPADTPEDESTPGG